MKQTLIDGTHIVCDRYAYSGVAFSSAKGLPIQWCQAADNRLLKPDVVIFMTAPLEILAARGDYGQERYERLEFQESVKR
jgi:dTMP kinase